MPSKVMICANKIDLVDSEAFDIATKLLNHIMPGRDIYPISAKTGENITSIIDGILKELNLHHQIIPASRYK